MIALDCLSNILNTNLADEHLKYCLVDSNKRPFKADGSICRPNHVEDFVELSDLNTSLLSYFTGLGISIQASNISAIDIDDCVEEAFNIETVSEFAKHIIDQFSGTYVEFSFSGHGIRILLKTDIIENYTSKYYIKNSKIQVEYYQPAESNRYVTITGRVIFNKSIASINILNFLNEYMLRPVKEHKEGIVSTDSFEKCMMKVKFMTFKNPQFQELWFKNAPGSGKDESERDYHLLCEIYESITSDKNMIKKIFEESPFFKSKDHKHMYKWTNQDYRYFNYLYERISER